MKNDYVGWFLVAVIVLLLTGAVIRPDIARATGFLSIGDCQ